MKYQPSFLAVVMYFAVIGTPRVVEAMNVVRPFKFFFNPAPHYGTRFQIFVMPEHGCAASGYTAESQRTDVSSTCGARPGALAMLKGFCCSSTENQKLSSTGASDNGDRGHFALCSRLRVNEGLTFAVRAALPHNIMLGVFLPLYRVSFDRVRWNNLTGHVLAADERVHAYVADGLDRTTAALGGLAIGPWRRTRLGDLACVGDWLQDFTQPRELLKNVRLDGRFGLTLPTGAKENVGLIAAFPLGYNGSVALIFGGGLELTLGSYLHAGFDVELRNIFGSSHTARIRTDADQTEPLVLARAPVYTDYAIEQQYTLYAQLGEFIKGFLIKCGYQFFKQGDSTSVLVGNIWAHRGSTSTPRGTCLPERNLHKVIMMATYDTSALTRRYLRGIPSISFYAEVPFGGKNIIASPFIGAVLGIDF